jgi:hypothetical protein
MSMHTPPHKAEHVGEVRIRAGDHFDGLPNVASTRRMVRVCGCAFGGGIVPYFCAEHNDPRLPDDHPYKHDPAFVPTKGAVHPAYTPNYNPNFESPHYPPCVLPPNGVLGPQPGAWHQVEEIDYSKVLLPTDPQERKGVPIATGVLDYFSAALAEIAKVSKAGNDQHNPGQPLHWSRGKSMDHADTMMRHFMERGTLDTDKLRHTAKMAWRALAMLQQEMEDAGAPMSRGSKVST